MSARLYIGCAERSLCTSVPVWEERGKKGHAASPRTRSLTLPTSAHALAPCLQVQDEEKKEALIELADQEYTYAKEYASTKSQYINLYRELATHHLRFVRDCTDPHQAINAEVSFIRGCSKERERDGERGMGCATAVRDFGS